MLSLSLKDLKFGLATLLSRKSTRGRDLAPHAYGLAAPIRMRTAEVNRSCMSRHENSGYGEPPRQNFGAQGAEDLLTHFPHTQALTLFARIKCILRQIP